MFLNKAIHPCESFSFVAQSIRRVTNRNRLIQTLSCFAAFLLSVIPAFCTEGESGLADSRLASGVSARDLTGLSLEELYNLDVIQLNVMGGHTHPAGQIMLGYEFMFMDMDGHRTGTDHISVSDILKKFPSASTGMTVEEHMAEVMYAPTNEFTLMAMLPFKHMEMDMKVPSNPKGERRFTEVSDGIGDLHVVALYTLLGSVTKGNRLILNAGMSFPTGSDRREEYDFRRYV